MNEKIQRENDKINSYMQKKREKRYNKKLKIKKLKI
jgi:hypothetical protein